MSNTYHIRDLNRIRNMSFGNNNYKYEFVSKFQYNNFIKSLCILKKRFISFKNAPVINEKIQVLSEKRHGKMLEKNYIANV